MQIHDSLSYPTGNPSPKKMTLIWPGLFIVKVGETEFIRMCAFSVYKPFFFFLIYIGLLLRNEMELTIQGSKSIFLLLKIGPFACHLKFL